MHNRFLIVTCLHSIVHTILPLLTPLPLSNVPSAFLSALTPSFFLTHSVCLEGEVPTAHGQPVPIRPWRLGLSGEAQLLISGPQCLVHSEAWYHMSHGPEHHLELQPRVPLPFLCVSPSGPARKQEPLLPSQSLPASQLPQRSGRLGKWDTNEIQSEN